MDRIEVLLDQLKLVICKNTDACLTTITKIHENEVHIKEILEKASHEKNKPSRH